MLEDDAFQRQLLVGVLARLGHALVREVADAPQALAVMREEPPDLVICDLQMPGMDGMEFLRHLGAAGAGADVVVVSAVDEQLLSHVRRMAQAYGIRLVDVLPKPLDPRRLQAVLARAADADGAAGASQHGDIPSRADAVAALQAGEFAAFFQPQVEIATGRLAGFEVLARWQRGHELLPAGTFLPVIEQDEGLLDALFWQMLREACAFAASTASAMPEATLSVNVSAATFAASDFGARVGALVAGAGISPGRIVLELTESQATGGSLGAILENMTRLRLRGFGLSIDDYGTGHSSLQQLARMPFTEMKIDRSFIDGAHADAAGLIVLKSTLELARNMRMVSVAEGVESPQQWELLRSLGCNVAQGWLLGAAMPAEEAGAWVVPEALALA